MTVKLDNEIIYTENADSVPHEVWDNHFKSGPCKLRVVTGSAFLD